MANLTLLSLQNEVYAHTGINPNDTDSNGNSLSTDVTQWLNYVQQDLIARYAWSFMLTRESIVTIPDYSTGTVQINSGSNTVNGTSTAWTSTQGNGTYYMQFPSANDWYKVTAQVSGTQLTLENPYQPSANVAAGSSYILRKFYYSLSSTCDRIIDIRNWNTPVKLQEVDARTVDWYRPNPQSTNSAYGYIAYGVDSSGNLVISPYPFPNDAREFEIRETKRPTDMVNPTDSPSVPNKYAHLLSWGAIAIGFAYLRKLDIAEAWSQKFEQRVSQMKGEYRTSEDYQPVLRSIDSVARSRWVQMPENFPTLLDG